MHSLNRSIVQFDGSFEAGKTLFDNPDTAGARTETFGVTCKQIKKYFIKSILFKSCWLKAMVFKITFPFYEP